MRIAIASVLLALVAGTAGAQATATIDSPRPGPAQRLSADDVPGTTFTSFCGFSHRNFDDMIVSPARPGAAHDHTYVGNRSTNAHSTLASLRRARTTCHRDADTAFSKIYADDAHNTRVASRPASPQSAAGVAAA